MIKEPLKIGFIGGGINSAVGNTHRIAAQMDNKWKLSAGCFSTQKDINKQTAECWGVQNYYDNWIDLLENEKNNLDAVAILTPTNIHYEMAQKVLSLGYAVICEKTLTTTYPEAVSIAEIVANKNNFLAVINNYTGYPMLRELREMIKSNRLGTIKHIQVEMPQEGFIRYDKNNKIPKPQKWRLIDGVIPTIHLDLGIHLYHIIYFLCNQKPIEVCSTQASCGFFKNIIDNVSCLANYTRGISCQIWFSKSALGNRNGLKIRVYGDQGSAEWLQIESETIKFCNKDGRIEIIDRASPEIIIANQTRYNRFKSGHPAGFIEAFANYYYDIADGLIEFKKSGKFNDQWIVSTDLATEGMKMLETMALSAKNKSWQSI